MSSVIFILPSQCMDSMVLPIMVSTGLTRVLVENRIKNPKWKRKESTVTTSGVVVIVVVVVDAFWVYVL